MTQPSLRHRVRCLALAVLVAGVAAGAGGQPVPEPIPEEPAGRFGETLEVRLTTVPLRVVDTGGSPILGLTAADMRARVGGRDVPVVALDWIGTAVEEPAARRDTEGGDDARRSPDSAMAEALDEGRLIVVFVQGDLHPSRVSGQMRLRPHTRQLLASLRAGDRVAVVSFDSHAKIRQDFSQDLEATHAAIDGSIAFEPEGWVERARPLSLLEHWDSEAAFDAGSPERALELVGRALGRLPGEKVLVFLGWGLGRYVDNGGGMGRLGGTAVRMTPDFAPAIHALREAHTSVFVLDVTSADQHSLSVGLEQAAHDTGGRYFATFRQPAVATQNLARTIAGYYLLTLDTAAAPRGGLVEIALLRRAGTVLHRPMALAAE
jgi:VWFA-related protein